MSMLGRHYCKYALKNWLLLCIEEINRVFLRLVYSYIDKCDEQPYIILASLILIQRYFRIEIK